MPTGGRRSSSASTRGRETQRCLHPGQRVGRQRGALLDRHADLVRVVDFVGRHRDDARLGGAPRVESRPLPRLDPLQETLQRLRPLEETRLETRQPVPHRQGPEIERRQAEDHRPVRIIQGVGPVARQRGLQERTGQARPRLDEREEAAGADVETPQSPGSHQNDFAREPVRRRQVRDRRVVGRHQLGVPLRLEEPEADLLLVEAQAADGIVQLAEQAQHPGSAPLPAERRGVSWGRSFRPLQPDGRGAALSVHCDVHERVGDVPCADPGVQRRKTDTGPALSRRRGGQTREAIPHQLVEAALRGDVVHESPVPGPLPLDPLRRGAEDIGVIAAHPPLVHQPRQPAGPRKDAEERHLGQAHRGAPVVDQEDLVAGERQLVAASRRDAVAGRQVSLPGLGAGLFDREARLVGELAEVHLEGVRRRSQHVDVGPGREDAVLPRDDRHRPDLRVLEAQALHRVLELDINAQVVRVQLQDVPGPERLVLLDVPDDAGHLTLSLQPPVHVPVGCRLERDGCLRRGLFLFHGTAL